MEPLLSWSRLVYWATAAAACCSVLGRWQVAVSQSERSYPGTGLKEFLKYKPLSHGLKECTRGLHTGSTQVPKERGTGGDGPLKGSVVLIKVGTTGGTVEFLVLRRKDHPHHPNHGGLTGGLLSNVAGPGKVAEITLG